MVAPDQPIHLDAVLAAVLVNNACRREENDPFAWQEKLPVAKQWVGDEWVWKASQLVFQIDPHATTNVINIRRYELPEWSKDKGVFWNGKKNVIPSGTGHAKAFLFNLPLWYCLKAYAWVDAEEEQIMPILRQVEFLGKNRRNGFGRVFSLNVNKIENKEQWKRRTLPESFHKYVDGHKLGMATVRPPYFRRDNQQAAWLLPIELIVE